MREDDEEEKRGEGQIKKGERGEREREVRSEGS